MNRKVPNTKRCRSNTKFVKYPGHLNSELLLVRYSNGQQFRCQFQGTGYLNNQPVFKWWSEQRSVNPMLI